MKMEIRLCKDKLNHTQKLKEESAKLRLPTNKTEDMIDLGG